MRPCRRKKYEKKFNSKKKQMHIQSMSEKITRVATRNRKQTGKFTMPDL